MDSLFINHLKVVHRDNENMPYNEKAMFIEIPKINEGVKYAYFTEQWYSLWSVEKIKRTFAFGHGTIFDFKEYVERNRNLIFVVNLETGEIL